MATNTSNLNLSKPAYTDPADIAVINDNMDKLDGAVNGVEDGLAIVANGNTHAAVAAGQFVYVRNHSSLAQGVYKATTAIAANGALSTSNLTADASGGLNALKADIDTLNSKFDIQVINPTMSSAITKGSVSCVVVAGWAFVSGMSLMFASSGSAQNSVITGLPACALQINGDFAGTNANETAEIRASGDSLWMNSTGSAINVHLGSAYNKYHWFSIAYPVRQ